MIATASYFSTTTDQAAGRIGEIDEAIARLTRTLEDASEALAPRDVERFIRSLTSAKEGLAQQSTARPNVGYPAAVTSAGKLAELERRRLAYLVAGTRQLTQQKALMAAMVQAASTQAGVAVASPNEAAKKKAGDGKDRLAAAGASAASVFGQLSAHMLSLSRAADPFVTTATLEDSFQALKIELGAGFLPVLDEVSRNLQRVAKWYRGLSAETKTVISVTIAATAGLAGLTYAFTLLGPAVMVALKGVVLIGSAAYAHPIVALATVVGGLAAAWYLVGRNAKDAGGAMGAAGKASVVGVPGGRGADLSKLDDADRRRITAAGAKGRDAQVAELEKIKAENSKAIKAEEDRQAAQTKMVELQAQARKFLDDWAAANTTQNTGGPFGKLAQVFGVVTNRDDVSLARARESYGQMRMPQLQEAYKQAGMKVPAGMDFWAGLRHFNVAGAAGLDSLRKREVALKDVGNGLGGDDELKRSYRGLPMPQITRPEAVADSVQIAALKTMGGSQESENLARQLQLAFGDKMVQALEKLDVHLEQIKHFVDPGWGY